MKIEKYGKIVFKPGDYVKIKGHKRKTAVVVEVKGTLNRISVIGEPDSDVWIDTNNLEPAHIEHEKIQDKPCSKNGVQSKIAKENFEKGLQQGILESAIAMLKNGIEPEMVVKCSGLPMSKILELEKY